MKVCPHCGYEDTLTNRQIDRYIAKEIPGGFPIREMIRRGWLRFAKNSSNIVESDLPELKAEFRRFVGVRNDDEWSEFIEATNAGAMWEPDDESDVAPRPSEPSD
jgi:hypothetical protein